MKKLKYIVVGLGNKTAHHSYTKKQANDWIKKRPHPEFYHIEKFKEIKEI